MNLLQPKLTPLLLFLKDFELQTHLQSLHISFFFKSSFSLIVFSLFPSKIEGFENPSPKIDGFGQTRQTRARGAPVMV